jgi:predicted RNA-binding protein with PUA domain
MNTPTIKTKNREKQAEIARKTAEFVANGGKVEAETVREAKPNADLHRNHAMSELEDAE